MIDLMTNALVAQCTEEIKRLVSHTADDLVRIGELLVTVKGELKHGQWEDWLTREFAWSDDTARRMMRVAECFKTRTVRDLPIEPGALYVLSAKHTPAPVVDQAINLACQGEVVTQAKAKALVEDHKRWAPESVPADEAPEDPHEKRTQFNQVNEMIDWAKWSWNPVTGCEHTCVYCYARDIANRFYPEKFAPTFHETRLSAPHVTHLPPTIRDLPEAEQYRLGWRNVFVCSMADLFGKWVPQAWIDAVLAEVRAAPQWNFLFLTKFPQRLAEIAWPDNAWVGTTVDEQYRVKIAEKAFREVQAPVKWLSCEPLRQRLTFESLDMFNWVVLGGQSASSQAPAMQPEWEWVKHLLSQAWAAGCLVYMKPNLTVRAQEYPGDGRPSAVSE